MEMDYVIALRDGQGNEIMSMPYNEYTSKMTVCQNIDDVVREHERMR
jgi:hypothetical protein